MDDIKAKQQIVEKIKASANVLVAVSNDPSVDALSAAIGLTLLLDKLDKHATAIFSGTVPPALAFLEPEKILDDTTDSLRDFIIALDKEKADHLRYKVEGDSVKIFITPYKTTISSDDLEFSQGDFNVELVIALGVDKQEHLDKALEAHGQILHDATIITVSAGDQTSTLGGIDWHDAQASSLSEMVAGLAEALKTDKTKSLLDKSIATAFLTGIVAQTDRFSNPHTTSRVMATAAQLMAGGADQQLIATKLEQAHQVNDGASTDSSAPSDPTSLDVQKDDAPTLDISLKPNETLEELDKRVKQAEQSEAAEVADNALSEQGEDAPKGDVPAESDEVHNAYAPESDEKTTTPETSSIEPALGGTLNATTEQAAEDARHAAENEQNKTLLSHSYLDASPSFTAPINGANDTDATTPESGIDLLGHASPPGSASVNDTQPATGDLMHSGYAADGEQVPTASAVPPMPPAPADLGLPMPPPLPDFSQAPNAPVPVEFPITPAPAYGLDPNPQPERLGDILAPEPTPAPLPTPPSEPAPIPPVPSPVPPITGPNDPGQFKIPGQQ